MDLAASIAARSSKVIGIVGRQGECRGASKAASQQKFQSMKTNAPWEIIWPVCLVVVMVPPLLLLWFPIYFHLHGPTQDATPSILTAEVAAMLLLQPAVLPAVQPQDVHSGC